MPSRIIGWRRLAIGAGWALPDWEFSMIGNADTPRDLLFGLLALQNGLIDQGALFSAFTTWTRSRERSMAAILRDQGVLDDDARTLLEALVAKHLKMHGGDPEKSLAAIGVGHSTREGLAQLNDPELTANLARVGTNQDPAAGGPVPVHRPRLPVFPGASQGPRVGCSGADPGRPARLLGARQACAGRGLPQPPPRAAGPA